MTQADDVAVFGTQQVSIASDVANQQINSPARDASTAWPGVSLRQADTNKLSSAPIIVTNLSVHTPTTNLAVAVSQPARVEQQQINLAESQHWPETPVMTDSPTIKCHRPALTHTIAQAANDNIIAAVPVTTPAEATSQTGLVVPETPVITDNFSNKQSELAFQSGLDQARLTSTTVVSGVTSTTSVSAQTSQVAAVAAPIVSSVITNPVATASMLNPNPPVVIVRQFQTPKPYSGQTSHRSFREHFERVAKANGWNTELEKMQNLALALEGPAIECLREVREDELGALYECIDTPAEIEHQSSQLLATPPHILRRLKDR